MPSASFFKKCGAIYLALHPSLTLATTSNSTEHWVNFADPMAIYSGVNVAGGNEGVNLTANYGGYLSGQYKHKITVQAMNDLDYYNADYLLLNASTHSGFTIESTWDRDIWKVKNLNDTSVGVFSKIPLLNEQLNIYPKLNLGFLWGNKVTSTTYIKLDATTRYTFNPMFWVGITPTYLYAMKGYELREIGASVDAGMQLSSSFALSAHASNDKEFWIDVTFAF